MPTYDYLCRSCGTAIEVIHGMREDGPTTCEACGGPLRRVLYPTGIIFKGSGFYRTDSRSSSSAASTGGSKGGESGSAGHDGGAKDAGSSKPADGASTSGSAPQSTAPTEAASS